MNEKVVFQGRLILPEDKNASEVREVLTQWVSTNPSLTIQGVKLEVDGTCPVTISDFDGVECTTNHEQSQSTLAIVLGPTTAGVLAIILLAVIVIILWCMWPKIKNCCQR